MLRSTGADVQGILRLQPGVGWSRRGTDCSVHDCWHRHGTTSADYTIHFYCWCLLHRVRISDTVQ